MSSTNAKLWARFRPNTWYSENIARLRVTCREGPRHRIHGFSCNAKELFGEIYA
jgi:hypothetical protein